MSYYDFYLWWNYASIFGVVDTIGMSVAGPAYRLQNMINIFDQTPYGRPYAFDVHIYDNATTIIQDINSVLIAVGQPPDTGIMIGEAYYNDLTEAQQIQTGTDITGRKIHFVTQWLNTRNSRCSNFSVAPPVGFNNYTWLH